MTTLHQMESEATRNIDEDFYKAMRLIGGKRPQEIDSLCTVNKYNADIVLEQDNLIIEVKTLLEDPRDKDDFHKKYGAMYNKWVCDGKVPPQAEPIKIDTATLPEECATEFLAHITRRIKRVVTKSNRQIKDLKSTLNMPTANGLMVLCNTGNAFLQPDVLLWGLHQALRNDHTSIQWLIYMTYGLPVQLSDMKEPCDLFTAPEREGFDAMPPPLFHRLQDAWMSYISTGTVCRVYDGSGMQLDGVKHQETL